jgi:toxin HigB-1
MRVRCDDEKLALVETDQAHRLRLPVPVVQAARRKLRILRNAADERELYAMKSLHYEKLDGARQGQRSIRLNEQWRMIIRVDQECQPVELVLLEISNHYG